MLNNVISLIVMALTGLVVGWRISSSVLDALVGFALVLLFAYAISWVMASSACWSHAGDRQQRVASS